MVDDKTTKQVLTFLLKCGYSEKQCIHAFRIFDALAGNHPDDYKEKVWDLAHTFVKSGLK